MRQAVYRCPVIALVLLGLAGQGFSSDKHIPVSRRTPIVEAVVKTKASVVTVKVPRQGLKDLVGTGVLVDERGYIITNRHVVGPAKQVTIVLLDNTELQGQVVVGDPGTDLAVVKIQTDKKLTALELAPISDLMVGETVLAVGHPYGFHNTVSTGIISALEREIRMPTGDKLYGLIQTTAPINPGNSGGPLLNINGELIGINVALREGAQCIAFAINADTVKQLLRKHLSAQRVAGVHHGLECLEKVLAETGPRQRVVVAGQTPEGDLKKGDEILAVGGRDVRNSFDLERALWDKRPGQKVHFKVVRGGQTLTVALTLRAGHGAVASTTPASPQEGAGNLRGVADKHR